jgi:iron complex outermembrane receptor protein
MTLRAGRCIAIAAMLLVAPSALGQQGAGQGKGKGDGDGQPHEPSGDPSHYLLTIPARVRLPEYSVTVRPTRRRPRTASSTRLTARHLAVLPMRTAEDVLRRVPGFTLVQHGSEGKGHQFFLRGFDAIHGADLEITLEGVPLNEWSNIHAQGYLDLGFIIPETIASVELTKGPFTVDQGAFAMAGSANYRLGIADGARGLRGSYTVGATNRHRGVVTYSPATGDGEDFIALEALHDDGFGQNRAIDRASLLGRVRVLEGAEAGTLSLLGASYLARFLLPGTVRNDDLQAGRLGFYDAYDATGHGLYGRGMLLLKHEWRRGGHSVETRLQAGYRRLELLENYTGFLLDPVNGDWRAQQQKSWSFGASSRYDLPIGRQFQLHFGLGGHGDIFAQKQEHVDRMERQLETERELDGLQLLTDALIETRWRPAKGLRFAAGLRFDAAHVSLRDGLADSDGIADTLVALSPRLTAEWRVVRSWRLFAAYGRGFRPPEARSFSSFRPGRTGVAEELYQGGDPALTLADAIEVGSRWLPTRYFGARLSGFATFIARESVFDHVSGVNLELNRTRRLGGELEVLSSPLPWLTLSADLTWVSARFVDSGNPIPLAPWLVGAFHARVSHRSGWLAGVHLFGMARRHLPHGARGSPMAVLDAVAGYRWRWLRVELELENLLNQHIREGEYHYASYWRRAGGASQLPAVHYVAGPPLNARLTLTALLR